MTPLDKIEKGIHEGVWGDVCEGYKELTGKDISPPSDMVPENENSSSPEAMQAIKRIQKIVGAFAKPIPKPSPKRKSKPSRKKTESKERKTGNDTFSIHDDTFLDDSAITPMKLDGHGGTQFITTPIDPEEVKANEEKAARARLNKTKICRKPHTTYTVECSSCNKEFQSTVQTNEIGQQCPKCLRRKIREMRRDEV